MRRESPESEIEPDNYRFLQQHVYSHAGLVLEEGKHYLLESRLNPIIRRLGLPSINHLCELLRRSRPREVGRQVAEAMTTNETYFFRDPAQYNAIRDVLLPRLMRERQTRRLRFWSAACSTGQEAYSLAMLLLEAGVDECDVEILGTDFCSAVVERARSGAFQQIEVNRGLPSPLLIKYFQRCGSDWMLCDRLRSMVNFEVRDLRHTPRSPEAFDLLFCRNVMIYFDVQTRIKLLAQLRSSLTPGGWLLLGCAESITGIEDHFDRLRYEDSTINIAR